MKLTVVAPTYNEVENITPFIDSVFKELSALPYEGWVLIADDNSPDGTAAKVKELQNRYPTLRLLEAPKKGLGAAYLRALNVAFSELGAEMVVTMDVDFSHDPTDIKHLVAAVSQGADLAIGSRYVHGGAIPSDWAWYRKVLSSGGNIVVRMLFGTRAVHEYTTAFRAFTKSLWDKLDKSKLVFSDNTFLPAFIYEANYVGAKIIEVPVVFKDRVTGDSKIEIGRYVPNLLKYAVSVFLRRLF